MQNHIIFDMDGVLVDSEPVHMEILNEVLDEMEVTISLEYYHSLVGMGALLIWEKLKGDFNLPGIPEELFASHKKYFNSVIGSKELMPVSGIINLLDNLQKENYAISLGSSSPVKLINHSVNKIGIHHYFDHFVSSEHVKKGKPFPDIFLRVAELYNVSPSQFVVIEDSKNGVLAAKAAGMTCIGLRNPNSGNQDLSKADMVIDHFDELTSEILRGLYR
ncbi:HAD family hydrolase [Abyssalbus ytuae]|uniref:HAD family phosphatase n=1 Tax=Abyssalbus ytuae TaxID=2926907 RepID=A0A9E6ZWB8_9FLAO|nr:HAD family phosphatase [Abyssalbus ytuae]UOB18001.1 HAD family phosphatase [Abyssalbus ytuae]